MNNTELIQTIRAEIEKLIERYGSAKAKGILQEGYKGGRLIGYEDALNILKRIQENLEKSTLESEKPINQNELEKELDFQTFAKEMEAEFAILKPFSWEYKIASHFAKWGYLRAAEKYDEIEYNRQRAEESVPTELDEAAEKAYPMTTTPPTPIEVTAYYNAAQQKLRDAFIAGYNLCKEQTLKEAVEVTVEDWNPEPHPEITIPLNPEEFIHGDRVRVIVIKDNNPKFE